MPAHSLKPRLLRPALLIVGLTACPSDKDITTDSTDTTIDTATDPTETPTTGEPAATCPEHTDVDACCCFEATPADEPLFVNNVCMTKSVCPTAEFECDDLDYICVTTTEEAVQCALETLSAGTAVGSMIFHYDIGNGYGDHRYELYLQGDGTTYMLHEEVLDVSDVYRPTGRFNLRPKAFFDDCLAETEIDAKAKCLQDTVDGEATETCIDEIYKDAL